MSKYYISLKSPRTGRGYPVISALDKFLERAGMSCEGWELRKLHTCFYGSSDWALEVDGWRTSRSQWGNSVNVKIDGVIPLHTTNDGRISVPFGCGCDGSHHGQFPQQAPPNNPNWGKYQEMEFGVVSFWLPEREYQADSEGQWIYDDENHLTPLPLEAGQPPEKGEGGEEWILVPPIEEREPPQGGYGTEEVPYRVKLETLLNLREDKIMEVLTNAVREFLARTVFEHR